MLINFLDLLRVANVEQSANAISMDAEPQFESWGYIWFPGNDPIQNTAAYVKIPIVHFEPPNFQSRRAILLANYYHKGYTCNMRHMPQAILPGFVPSVESLIQAWLVSNKNFSVASPFARLSNAFRNFVESYCSSTVILPLVSTLT